MESFTIKNLSFTYPTSGIKALNHINLAISQGEFVAVCGWSGCGKTTLLRMLKTVLAPVGSREGMIYFNGKPLPDYDAGQQASAIGFVMQSPENQIVTDTVWHELAFGLESLGYSTPEIRSRVSEMASFFGIETWFHKKVTELSGGQKQLLNLASVMAMSPAVLILDEPTSQLDPIAAQDFLNMLEKINRDLGVTVIMTEHRLEEVFPICDRVVVMDGGSIIADGTPNEVGDRLKALNHDMCAALPTPVRVYNAVDNTLDRPLTVREGRAWLEQLSIDRELHPELIPGVPCGEAADAVVTIKDAWFRYQKDLPDVIKGMNLTVKKGELFALMGGNGTGKTTALSLASGLNTPYRGEVLIKGTPLSKIRKLYNGVLGVLPQNPQSVFVKKTVYLDLMDILEESKLSDEEKNKRINSIAALCRIENLLNSHPYDLSGGEQQRAALAKVLLKEPEILLLDEPTKGMDASFKENFAEILEDLKAGGVTVLMVSHDIEFCAKYADRCGLFFDGAITSIGHPRAFFAGKSFYTTAANRMARTRLSEAILAEDIILACGGGVSKKERKKPAASAWKEETTHDDKTTKAKKLSPLRIITGSIFALLFVFSAVLLWMDVNVLPFTESAGAMSVLQIAAILELAVVLYCFLPGKELGVAFVRQPEPSRKLTKQTLAAVILILLAIPLTIFAGAYFFDGRNYYLISLLIIIETMIPFCMVFENRKPQARELVIISVLCAIAVGSRAAFFMLPQFKPVVALVIIAGVCLGGETGFLVGSITGFVSNFFLGQGPWTPWQMFAFGIIGFLAGVVFKKGLLRRTKVTLCVFGFFAAIFIYGGIMNPLIVLQTQAKPTFEMLAAAYVSGAPFDLVHAVSTAFFLWFISEAMIDKLERIKIKYGLLGG